MGETGWCNMMAFIPLIKTELHMFSWHELNLCADILHKYINNKTFTGKNWNMSDIIQSPILSVKHSNVLAHFKQHAQIFFMGT